MAMHADELEINEPIVRLLIDEQFPVWCDLPVRRLDTAGTDNAIFRIGSDFAARFPLQPAEVLVAHDTVARETGAMRELAACIPFPTPNPVAEGASGHGYPLPWAVQTWLPGHVATPAGQARSTDFAQDLALLIRAMRASDTRGRRFAGDGRGGGLRDSDDQMVICFRESEGLLPIDRIQALWKRFRTLPDGGPDVMSHSDLIPGNLLVEDDRVIGVLDGGSFGPADPSLDLVVAWHLLDAPRRALFRRAIGCGDVEWQRGAAWAFQQAMGLVWYYRESNISMSELGRSTLSRIVGAVPAL